jgi:hypothetical protein
MVSAESAACFFFPALNTFLQIWYNRPFWRLHSVGASGLFRLTMDVKNAGTFFRSFALP